MRYPDPLIGDYEAKCSFCGFEAKLELLMSMGLKVGDLVYRDPENERVGKCNRCKRYTLEIIKAPPGPEPASPEGFWRIPTE